jgi:hypothetical protein
MKTGFRRLLLASALASAFHCGCTPQRLGQFIIESSGYTFYYEEATRPTVVAKGIKWETDMFERSRNSPTYKPFGLNTTADFEPVAFRSNDRFVLQHDMYVWDVPEMGARNTLNGKRLAVSPFPGPYEYSSRRQGEEPRLITLRPIRRIPSGTAIRFKEYRSFSCDFTDEVAIVCFENCEEDFILRYHFTFLWLKPKSSAPRGETEKLPFIPN